jgi:hypothetical protein
MPGRAALSAGFQNGGRAGPGMQAAKKPGRLGTLQAFSSILITVCQRWRMLVYPDPEVWLLDTYLLKTRSATADMAAMAAASNAINVRLGNSVS